jgi:hypothetical protein
MHLAHIYMTTYSSCLVLAVQLINEEIKSFFWVCRLFVSDVPYLAPFSGLSILD